MIKVNWECFFGLHDMQLIRVKDSGKGVFTTGKFILVQCTRCKEFFNGG